MASVDDVTNSQCLYRRRHRSHRGVYMGNIKTLAIETVLRNVIIDTKHAPRIQIRPTPPPPRIDIIQVSRDRDNERTHIFSMGESPNQETLATQKFGECTMIDQRRKSPREDGEEDGSN